MRRVGTFAHQHTARLLDLNFYRIILTPASLPCRSSQRGGTIRVNATKSFASTLSWALARVNASIKSKLDDFFGLSEYDWTPNTRETAPSMYLYELVNWLTTVVDSLVIKDGYKDKAYRAAVEYLAGCLAVGRSGLCLALRPRESRW